MTTTKEIIKLIDTVAPFCLAEDWDNCGMQSGDLSWNVKKVMVALDISMQVMQAAKDWNADAVVTHHPLIMSSISNLDFGCLPGSIIAISILEKISIISAHTNLDKATNGLNDYFMSILGIKSDSVFSNDLSGENHKDHLVGIGRVGKLNQPIILKDFIKYVKEKFDIKALRVAGDLSLNIEKVAICTGSGGSLVNEFIQSGAQVYITGDVKYHEARTIEENGLGLIDVGHFASEHIAVDLLTKLLNKAAIAAGLDIEIKGFKEEQDPLSIV